MLKKRNKSLLFVSKNRYKAFFEYIAGDLHSPETSKVFCCNIVQNDFSPFLASIAWDNSPSDSCNKNVYAERDGNFPKFAWLCLKAYPYGDKIHADHGPAKLPSPNDVLIERRLHLKRKQGIKWVIKLTFINRMRCLLHLMDWEMLISWNVLVIWMLETEVGKSKSGLGLKSDLWRKLLDLDLTWTRPLEDLDLLGLRHFFRSPDHYSSVSDVSWFFPFLFALCARWSFCGLSIWTIKTNMTKISTEDWNIGWRS